MLHEVPALAIGVDLGGTKIEAALVDRAGAVHCAERIAAPRAAADIHAAVVQLVRRVMGSATIAGIGFAIPGSLDPLTGILRNAPNSPGIEGTPLARDLAAVLPQRPLAFDNDANCLVKSEHRFGAARGYECAVGVIMGTGVGGGVIAGSRLLPTWRGLAPEPGHMPLIEGGRPCGCGKHGCFEAYLSGPAILGRYREAGGDPVCDGAALFTRAAVAAASDRCITSEPIDRIAAAVIDTTMAYFARFIAALVAVYDPQIIVLGGGLSHQPLYYQQSARIAPLINGSDQPPTIVAAAGGDASGKLGAAALIFDGESLWRTHA